MALDKIMVAVLMILEKMYCDTRKPLVTSKAAPGMKGKGLREGSLASSPGMPGHHCSHLCLTDDSQPEETCAGDALELHSEDRDSGEMEFLLRERLSSGSGHLGHSEGYAVERSVGKSSISVRVRIARVDTCFSPGQEETDCVPSSEFKEVNVEDTNKQPRWLCKDLVSPGRSARHLTEPYS